MAEYPQSIKVYANLASVWTDITSDVYAPDKITGYWGMRDNRELTRVADVGRMNFTLNNDEGLYAPNLGTALAGWGKGTQVKLVITYRDREHIKFFGTVDSLRITGGALGVRRVYVTVKDWMDYAAKHPLVSPGYQTNKRMDEALTTIIAGMPIQPQDTTFGTGVETFPTVFDAVTTKTRAQSEFNKLALSEMGYVYLKKDFTTGENLVAEPRTQRKGTDSPTTYSVPAADSGFLILQDGSYLVQQDGTSKFKLNTADSLTLDIDNNMQDIGVEYGNNIINRVSMLAYPRRVDTSNAVLFSIGFPLQIGAGETIEFRGGYFDPSGGAIVNAVSGTMVTPVSGTDYIVNTVSDGSGTNITADLVVSADYGTEGVTYTLTNTNTATGYITTLQARGRGVYTYATLESVVENQESIDAYGYNSETLHQMYQQNTILGKIESARILNNQRLPRTVLNTVSINANKSADLMYGFLLYDIGDLAHIKEDISGIDGQYYIQYVSFSIDAALTGSGVIDYSWTLKQNLSISGNFLSLVSVEFNRVGVAPANNNNNFIDCGILSYLNSSPYKSYSFWINITGSGAAIFYHSGGGVINGLTRFGVSFDVGSSMSISEAVVGGGTGVWEVTPGPTSGVWTHIVIVKDSSTIMSDPIVYQDGVLQSTSILLTQTGLPNYTNNFLTFGGARAGSVSATDSIIGSMKDIRCYTSLLSASDVLGIYNDGVGGVAYLNDIVFQGPTVPTSELSYFTNHTMLSTDRLLDNVYQTAITPGKIGAVDYPITRLP